jgi:hypothetical protein
MMTETEEILHKRIDELEAKVERLCIRGIEDMQFRITELESELAKLQWVETSFPPKKNVTIEVFNSGETPPVFIHEYEVGEIIYELGEYWREVSRPAQQPSKRCENPDPEVSDD